MNRVEGKQSMAHRWRTTRAPAAAALALALGAACNQSGRTASNSTTTRPLEVTTVVTDPPSTTSTTLTEDQEVEKAYLHYWDVYTQALRDLDQSHLDEALAGSALADTQNEIAKLKKDNTPVRNGVEHNYKVVLKNLASANVIDRFRNHLVLFDGSTGIPKEPDPNKVLNYTYSMERRDNTWKVTLVTGDR